MTEQDWQKCADPQMLLWYLWTSEASTRKLCLAAVACCRRIADLLVDDRSKAAIEVAERAADGTASADDVWAAWTAAQDAHNEIEGSTSEAIELAHLGVIYLLTQHAKDFEDRNNPDENEFSRALFFTWQALGNSIAEQQTQCRLVRDIFGNPFHSVSADPAWLTSTVVSLARQMYEFRDFSPMPILADALQEAGCDDADILNHCRSDGPHVRGCWAGLTHLICLVSL